MRASLFCGMLIFILSVAVSVNTPVKASDLQDLSLEEVIEHRSFHDVYVWAQKHPLSVNHELTWEDNRGVPRTGSLLQWAIARGHMPLIQYLQQHGFAFSESQSYWDSALALSARSGDIETFQYVLQQGADPFVDQRILTLVLGDLVYGGNPDMLAFFLHEEASQSPFRQAMLTRVLSERVEPNDLNLNGNTALMSACFFNELEMAALLMERGADVNLKNNAGKTALFEAAEHSLELVKRLVARGADIHVKDESGYTALTNAVRRNQLGVVKFMVSQGASLQDLQGPGLNLLWVATGHGATDVVSYLIAQGLDPNLPNEYGETLLMRSFLLNFHFVNLNSGILDEAEYTERQTIVLQSVLEIAQLLIAKGADVNAKTQDGRTVLMAAVEGGSLEGVRLLIDNGARPEIETENGYTFLMAAAKSRSLALMEYFIAQGIPVNAQTTHTGQTALSMAIQNHDFAMVKGLIAHGASPYYVTLVGHNALMEAALTGRLDIVEFLVHWEQSQTPVTQQKGLSNETPIGLAARVGALEVVQFLFEQLSPQQKQNEGYAALQEGIYRNRADIVSFLLEKGVNPNHGNAAVDSLLIYATQSNRPEITALLLRYGADPKYKDSTGKTALDYARENNDQALIQLLSGALPFVFKREHALTFSDFRS